MANGSRGTATQHTSTRPLVMYGRNKPWPLPGPERSFKPSHPLDMFLAHSAAGTSLVERDRYYYGASWDAESPPDQFSYATSLARTTLVTFASDYSIYRQEEFVSAMDALRGVKVGSYLCGP